MGSPLFLLSLFLCFILVSSQTDSCSSNLALTPSVSFNTTALNCQSVWSSEDFILRFQEATPGLWSFVLSAPDTNSWVAVGFSNSGRMSGTSAVIGWPTGNGNGVIKQYYLNGYSRSSVQPDQGNLNMANPVFVSKPSRVYLAFQLKVGTPLSSLIYAVGPRDAIPASDGLLNQHRSCTSTTLDFSTGKASPASSRGSDDDGDDSQESGRQSQGGSRESGNGSSRTSLTSSGSSAFTLKRTHGLLNGIAWVILLPLGIIAARYYKHRDPGWFYSHLALQMTGFGLAIAGLLTGISLEGQFDVEDGHKLLAFVAFGLASLQVTALLIRPDKKSKFRRYWNWYHHWVGRSAVLIGIINVFYGMKLAREPRSWYEYLGIVLAMLGLTSVVLEVKKLYSNYSEKL